MKSIQVLTLFILFFALGTSCEMIGIEQSQSPEDVQETAIEFRSDGYDWNFNSAPYNFLFGNHFDTHQQTKQSGSNNLNGFFYITISREENGIPLANHGNCNENPDGCTVGWTLHGIKMEAELLQKGMGHPQWYISPEKMPRQRGYTHFHWIKKKDHGGGGHQSNDHGNNNGSDGHNGGLEVGATYEGYILKLTARKTFYFEHHGSYLVTPGIDFETHANIHTSK